MKVDLGKDSTAQKSRFGRLGILYILALGAIALVAVVGQVLIQLHLRRQLRDSEIVNVAGRQRMLSQQIAKDILRLTVDGDTIAVRELRSSVKEWRQSQRDLQHGKNTPEVEKLFGSIEGSHQRILTSVDSVLAELQSGGEVSAATLRSAQKNVLHQEPVFLEGMNAIVDQYAFEARDRVASLSVIEYVFIGISLLVIFLEMVFVFRPTAQQVSHAVDKLTDSEKNALKLSKEIGALYASLEKSYQQMAVVNQPIDNPRLFAKADRGGNVTFISDQLRSITQKNGSPGLRRFSDLFPSMKDPDDWMDEMIERVSDGHSWRGELAFTDTDNKERWVDVIITPVYGEQQEIEELVMAGADITHHKIAEKSMIKKNMAEIEKTINQQKFRSVLILEGQEEERKRIAMDIHDGIGQMLTSLKFHIESIDLKNEAQAEKKIGEIGKMIRDVIKEVRKVTFDLKPTVLGDYGLQAGLNVFITEIGKLTHIDLVLDAQGEAGRLPQKIENNIFRIIQEAINNAIKYSDAPKIEVIIRQSPTEIVATVRDEGRGFDTRIVDARSVNIESGRGFFNMYERTEYVNGHLEINSTPGKGTTVELRVPLHYDTVHE
jgi:two-component system sensor histidine kinase DegS